MRHGATGQGSNSVQVRQYNERLILTLLRRLGEASKADLARHARLTSNTAGQIVRDLAEQRLVRALGKRSGARGQPATILRLDPEGAYSIGFKLGRRSLDALLVDFAGRVLERRRLERAFPMPEEAVAFAAESVAGLRCLLGGPAGGRIAGLGVAMPYNLGSWQRELDIPLAAYRRWNEFDLGAALAEATGLEVFCENDGTSAAVAELFQGQDRTLDDFLYVFIGAALGGGVVLGGDYHRGAHANAGDLGLMPTGPSRLGTAPRPNGRPEIALDPRLGQRADSPPARPRPAGRQPGAAGRPARAAAIRPWTNGWRTPSTRWWRRCCPPCGCWTWRPWSSTAPAAAGARPADRAAGRGAGPGLARSPRPAAPGARHGRARRAGDRCRHPAAALELQLQPRSCWLA